MDWLKNASYLKKLGTAILKLFVGAFFSFPFSARRVLGILSIPFHLIGKIPFPLCPNKGTQQAEPALGCLQTEGLAGRVTPLHPNSRERPRVFSDGKNIPIW